MNPPSRARDRQARHPQSEVGHHGIAAQPVPGRDTRRRLAAWRVSLSATTTACCRFDTPRQRQTGNVLLSKPFNRHILRGDASQKNRFAIFLLELKKVVDKRKKNWRK